MHFDIRRKVFEYEFRHDPQVSAPTEFFIPNFQFPHGYRVEISDGTFTINLPDQLLAFQHTAGQEDHKIGVKP
jgi:hypothetical protein